MAKTKTETKDTLGHNMQKAMITHDNAGDMFTNDPHYVLGKQGGKTWQGRWKGLYREGADETGIYDVYEATLNADKVIAMLAYDNGKWIATIIHCGQWVRTESYASMYDARNAAFVGAWEVLNHEPI